MNLPATSWQEFGFQVGLWVEIGQGRQGGFLVEAIDRDGQVWPWLYALEGHDRPSQGHWAPHELDGPLPADVLARLQAVPLRCGGGRRDGLRCRIPVAHPGVRCHHHRRRTT